MLLAEIIKTIEAWAPPAMQESYDNSGLIVGRYSDEISGVLVSLDCTEEIVDEAIELGYNLIVSHHPIVFSGLKRFNSASYIERVVEKAIKHNICLYAAHTNLDNVKTGVNAKLASKLGLTNLQFLDAKSGRYLKLVTFVPEKQLNEVQFALFNAGAGKVSDYDQCSFYTAGVGGFRGNDNTNPFVGKKGVRHEEPECRLEVIVPDFKMKQVEQALNESHPYEEVAYDWIQLQNKTEFGSGMVGDLPDAISLEVFLKLVKTNLNAEGIRYTKKISESVKRIAICGGSGSFLLNKAKAANADVFLTADYKYHQFFDAENDIVICDVGHFESEQYTIELIAEFLNENFPTFAVRSTQKNTNPINYFN